MISKEKIELFENVINFQYQNKQNLINALIHPSYLKELNSNEIKSESHFERFEFLGDRVLGLAVASLIFNKFKNLNEGDLTKKLSYLVKKEFLYKIALEINIDRILLYSFKKENLRMNAAILSDSVESLIGSMFVDSGYILSLKFIKKIWGPYLDIKASNYQDPKTYLQEISQQKNKTLPEYLLIDKKGPPHQPTFKVSLSVFDLKKITASGDSIREAEKNAARKAINIINEK